MNTASLDVYFSSFEYIFFKNVHSLSRRYYCWHAGISLLAALSDVAHNPFCCKQREKELLFRQCFVHCRRPRLDVNEAQQPKMG